MSKKGSVSNFEKWKVANISWIQKFEVPSLGKSSVLKKLKMLDSQCNECKPLKHFSSKSWLLVAKFQESHGIWVTCISKFWVSFNDFLAHFLVGKSSGIFFPCLVFFFWQVGSEVGFFATKLKQVTFPEFFDKCIYDEVPYFIWATEIFCCRIFSSKQVTQVLQHFWQISS